MNVGTSKHVFVKNSELMDPKLVQEGEHLCVKIVDSDIEKRNQRFGAKHAFEAACGRQVGKKIKTWVQEGDWGSTEKNENVYLIPWKKGKFLESRIVKGKNSKNEDVVCIDFHFIQEIDNPCTIIVKTHPS